MTCLLSEIINQFQLDAPPAICDSWGNGHINVTYLVISGSGKRYILQKINNNVFKDVDALMNNVGLVTHFLLTKVSDPREVLTLVPARDGSNYIRHETGYWRMYDFVEGSICLQQPETPADFYESAVGFGRFQQQLQDFPVEKLVETIPNFHNTPDRYRIFHETLEKDPMNRAKFVAKEIEFALAREEEMKTLEAMRASGELPSRVTHNDTKLNNVLLDARTRKALCVIDLDTVMPGLSLYDFGDSIRFGAATAAEDEQNLSKVTIDLELFRTYLQGFTRACPGLTAKEIEMLPLGAKTMTIECGVRFLTDYLDGDHYFAIHRKGQNLDRCRTQFEMALDMERKWDEMHEIVRHEVG